MWCDCVRVGVCAVVRMFFFPLFFFSPLYSQLDACHLFVN